MEQEKNKVQPCTLYLVATPIGNLADISERARKVLSEVDFVAAEDTRNSLKLLSLYGIHQELVSYHEHNKHASGERILSRLLGGESCALITDAGMPAISDPGEDLVRLCAERGVTVSVVPGACAAVSALALSALPTRRFVFEGFLSAKGSERREQLEALSVETRTLILYEAPHKLRRTLTDLSEVLGSERRIALVRELTKLNEEVRRTTLGEANLYYEVNEPRGEYVLVLEGADPARITRASSDVPTDTTPEQHVAYYERQGLGHMDAIKAAARDRGMSKSAFYKLLCANEE